MSKNDYLKSNHRANCCFLTAIIDTYYDAFQKERTSGERKFKQDITYNYLIELLELDDATTDIGCTIEKAKIFFKRWDLRMVVYDIYMKVIDEFTPEKRNKHISPNTMYVISHDNHIFLINNDVKSIQQKVVTIETNAIQELKNKISTNFKILDDDKLNTDNIEIYDILE